MCAKNGGREKSCEKWHVTWEGGGAMNVELSGRLGGAGGGEGAAQISAGGASIAIDAQ